VCLQASQQIVSVRGIKTIIIIIIILLQLFQKKELMQRENKE